MHIGSVKHCMTHQSGKLKQNHLSACSKRAPHTHNCCAGGLSSTLSLFSCSANNPMSGCCLGAGASRRQPVCLEPAVLVLACSPGMRGQRAWLQAGHSLRQDRHTHNRDRLLVQQPQHVVGVQRAGPESSQWLSTALAVVCSCCMPAQPVSWATHTWDEH